MPQIAVDSENILDLDPTRAYHIDMGLVAVRTKAEERNITLDLVGPGELLLPPSFYGMTTQNWTVFSTVYHEKGAFDNRIYCENQEQLLLRSRTMSDVARLLSARCNDYRVAHLLKIMYHKLKEGPQMSVWGITEREIGEILNGRRPALISDVFSEWEKARICDKGGKGFLVITEIEKLLQHYGFLESEESDQT